MDLPKFRRFASIAAFSEGWGLYSESLGEKLGCYTDTYQKLGALGAEIALFYFTISNYYIT